MNLPEIYADFHNLDDENRIRLTTLGSITDIARLGIRLREGMPITVAMDDADDDGNDDDLMADAVLHYSEAENCWVAQIDWSNVQNRSEREKSKRPAKAPTARNGARPASKKKRTKSASRNGASNKRKSTKAR